MRGLGFFYRYLMYQKWRLVLFGEQHEYPRFGRHLIYLHI